MKRSTSRPTGSRIGPGADQAGPVHSGQPGERRDSPTGLLEQFLANPIEDDYAEAAAAAAAAAAARSGAGADQLSAPTSDERSHLFVQRTRNVALVAAGALGLGLLLALAAVQTRADEPVAQRDREALIGQIDRTRQDVAARQAGARQLRGQVNDLTRRIRDQSPASDAALDPLRVNAASTAVRGPGLVLTAHDSPTGRAAGRVEDTDLSLLVNGLWQAGAEAIAVNGERLGPGSAIRTAGEAVTVDYHSLTPPYVLLVIGPADQIRQAFNVEEAGREWADLRRSVGIRLDIRSVSALELPAASPRPRAPEPVREGVR